MESYYYSHFVAKESENKKVVYTIDGIIFENDLLASQIPISIPAKVIIFLYLFQLFIDTFFLL